MLKRALLTLLALSTFFMQAVLPVNAQAGHITNPAISTTLGGNPTAAKSGDTFQFLFIYFWRVVIVFGSLLVLVYFLWAGIEWITAGGDSGKVGKARDKIIQSILGAFILTFSYIIINFISLLVFGNNFDLLSLDFPSAL